jgi:hypothetical protein
MNNNNSVFIPPKGYNILKYGEPHTIIKGKFAGQFRNMYWKVKDKNDNTYYMMHITDNIYTKISKRDINKVLEFKSIRPSWYLHSNGYIATTVRTSNTKFYYLHQLIMDVHDDDNTDFQNTVDHINMDKMDNRHSNLRLVNMSVQNSNRGKPERRVDACDLPNGIVQSDLPKYVVYRNERYKLSNNKLDSTTSEELENYNYRDYFYICNHPKLEKTWETTKSMNVSIHEKLKQAKLKLQELDGNITREQYNKESGLDKIIDLPVGIRLIEQHEKKQLVFDLRKDDKRYNIKMVLKSTNLQTELDNFIDMINNKYPEFKMDKYIIKNIPIIKETEVSTTEIKKEEDTISLPPNISLYNEKENLIFEFNKTVDKVRKNMKYKLKSNNIQDELNKFLENINTKYPDLKIPNYVIPYIPEKYKNIIKVKEIIDNTNTPKPNLPTNFSICCVNGTEYIQFCKKIDDTKLHYQTKFDNLDVMAKPSRVQYKTRINSYDIQSELNRFTDYLNDQYNFQLDKNDYKVENYNNWKTTNNIIDHTDTPLKISQRERSNKYNEKKKQELGEEKYKELMIQNSKKYRTKQMEIEV